MTSSICLFSTWIAALLTLLSVSVAAEPPNVILMMTDDQGIGDFGFMGNDLIETPHLDAMATVSARMETFYVSPVCSPTRASLMTGRYNHRTRCIDTWKGRSMMDTEEITIAELLRGAGYATGIFGKWHLGDCYPMRPIDQGFDESIIHLGGGLAQPSEPLENARRYTDPILFRNGKPEQTKGYCTDVYFREAIEFINARVAAKKRFFAYIATNAPHGPYHDVPPELLAHYKTKDLTPLMIQAPKNEKRLADLSDRLARIAAMITNEDENVGRLIQRLAVLGVLENTLIIRINDNGPNSMRYVGNMRGMKSHVHEGGVRSPCWLHWPAGLEAGKTSKATTAHIDLLPTILDACGVDAPDVKLDGQSFLSLLALPDENETDQAANDRAFAATALEATFHRRPLVIQAHRGDAPVPYHHFMIRKGDWKLVHPSGFGKESFKGDPAFELYNLVKDPREETNLVADKPEILGWLKTDNDAWFEDVGSTRPDNYAPPRIVVNSPHENPTHLTRQDWRVGDWRPRENGHWLLDIADAKPVDLRVIFHPGTESDRAETFRLSLQDLTLDVTAAAGASEVRFENVPTMVGPTTFSVSQVDARERDRVGVYQVEWTARAAED